MSPELKLFYWICYRYEDVFLTYAKDEETAYERISKQVSEKYKHIGVDVPSVWASYVTEFTSSSPEEVVMISISDGQMD